MIVTAMMLVAAVEAQPPVGSRPFRLGELKTQPGYEVSVFARGLNGARHMTFGPNGVLYVAARGSGTIVTISSAGETVTALSGLNGPHSLAFRGSDLYISTDNAVLRFRNAVTDDLVIRGSAERLVSLPSGGGHVTRTLGISPDGALFVTAGSTCNFCVESDPRRAAMMRYSLDGSGETIYARGLRNSVSFAWHPVTGALWALDNGGDDLGDDTPPEEVNAIEGGADYGWPDCFGDQQGVSWGPGARPSRCVDTKAPEFKILAHSAPLGISFYTGDQFPASFKNDALVGLHGSWNRNEPSGAKVIRVRASTGHALDQEDFLWGFYDAATRTRSGRPVYALNGPDGAVYVSDDENGNIYRIIYAGPRINPGGIVKAAEGIYELYGTNLVNSSGELNIYVNGQRARTLYVSAGQVNFALPDGAAGDVTVLVRNDKAQDQAQIRVE